VPATHRPDPDPDPDPDPSHADELVALLEALRDDLEERAAALRAGANVPSGGISFGKRVGEGTSIAIERFADVAIHEQIMHQLAGVEAALVRVAEGRYGICDVCRLSIAAERLEAIPWAATCVSCA
jgi:DnaK suppressor protein